MSEKSQKTKSETGRNLLWLREGGINSNDSNKADLLYLCFFKLKMLQMQGYYEILSRRNKKTASQRRRPFFACFSVFFVFPAFLAPIAGFPLLTNIFQN
jgi:hypothetical protein